MLPAFPDVEAALLDLLSTVATTVVETGDPLSPPVIRINRVGGAVYGNLTDRPRVEIACYGSKRADARTLDEQVRQAMLAYYHGGTTPDGVLLDRVREDTSPTPIPYEAPDVRRVVSTYVVSLRRPRT